MEKHEDVTSILIKLDLDNIEKTISQPYHEAGPGRPPRSPLGIFKALMIKQLRNIPSDRELYRRLWNDEALRIICDIEDREKPYHPSQLTRFRNRVGTERLECIMASLLEELVEEGVVKGEILALDATFIKAWSRRDPADDSHGLFTHFRHRLGQDTYNRIFNQLLRRLLKDGAVKAEVIAVDSTHVDAYSQRAPDNRTGRSDPEARVGRGRRGFIIGYRVHTACCAESEMPLAFTVAPCNENDKVYFKPLLQIVHALGVKFRTVLADAQYSSSKVRETARGFGAEPVTPVRRDSRVKDALKVGRDFVTRGAQRLVELFRGRWSVERLFGRAKEWLLLGCLKLRGLEQVAIHACLCFTAMLAVAQAAVRCREPGLMRSIKHFTV